MPDEPRDTPIPDCKCRIQQAGLRCTRQRELIYETLAATTAHPSAEELHAALNNADASISLATVYNTLDALTACGLVHRIPARDGKGPSRYDADVSSHAHLVTQDGRVADLPAELHEQLMQRLPPEFLAELEPRLGVPIDRVSIQLIARADRA